MKILIGDIELSHALYFAYPSKKTSIFAARADAASSIYVFFCI